MSVSHVRRAAALLGLALTVAPAQDAGDAAAVPFFVEVVDAATGRGVPLVELETVHGVRFVTDSAGVAVVDEPGWNGAEMWFAVRSHGYELGADGFGNRGFRVVVAAGTSRRVELQRRNVAERLYRVTGADIYRDSRRIGRAVPAILPSPPAAGQLGNGGVLGQDSVLNAIYGGRLYWFWGDTARASYPLGNFAASGAVSELPAQGGLDPAVGVRLTYFVDDQGFSRPMCPLKGPGPVWLDGLTVLDDGEGGEVMVCHYARIRDLGSLHEHGFARWHDAEQRFVPFATLPIGPRLHPFGHPLRVRADDGDWLYFCDPFPCVRVRARLADYSDPGRYEAYTCLSPGSEFDVAAPAIERDGEGRLVWGWKPATAPIDARQWRDLVAGDKVGADEGWTDLQDVVTGSPVVAHFGHVCFNAHRGRYVMLFTEIGGSSLLGEVWYAESRELGGPWGRALRIVTHDDYSFYNVRQHPCFAGDGGRLLYFEGTYTKTFSGTKRGTPRYDYNQIMYRLDLGDPRVEAAFGAPAPR
ncbi:MAG: hypothetical protein KDE27_15685 [Planctomycetes bacterium]|nr:hypothetical protein [Planctomycetota bacterium]